MNEDRRYAWALAFDDPGMNDVDLDGWSENNWELRHESGARVVCTGPHGRWVYLAPGGRQRGGYFKRPSTALAKA